MASQLDMFSDDERPRVVTLVWMPAVLQVSAVLCQACMCGHSVPLAGVVFSGSGPNLDSELEAQCVILVSGLRSGRSFVHPDHAFLTFHSQI